MRRLSGLAGRIRALGGAEVEVPGVRHQVHVADRHRPRGLQEAARIRAALGGRVAEGATLVHDRERAHNVPAGENGLADESYKADARDLEYLEAMEPVNNLRSLPKRYLWRFTGMDPGGLQSYLNPYVCFFRVKRDDERWPKIARVVRHLPMAEARFRR